MLEQNSGRNGSLTAIVSETAKTARRLALEAVRDEKESSSRFEIYQKMIDEELNKGNDSGALGLIQELENDVYCQSLGYLTLKKYYQGKSEINRAKEMFNLSLEKAKNAGAEKDELYLQIVDEKFAANDTKGIEVFK